MNNKEKFIMAIEKLLEENPNILTEDEKEFFNTLKLREEKPLFTKNGKNILIYMKNSNTSLLTAKEIGVGLNISSRSVSGSLRKLVTDGYAEKVGQNPTSYRITELGKEIEINEEENN